MFDIGWQELFAVGVLTLIVVGPKELPRVLRTVLQMVKKVKGMAREFQGGIDDIVREAELEEIRDKVAKNQGKDFVRDIEEQLDLDAGIGDDFAKIQDDLDKTAKKATDIDADGVAAAETPGGSIGGEAKAADTATDTADEVQDFDDAPKSRSGDAASA